MLDIEDIKRALKKVDLLERPYALIAPPKYKEILEENFKDSYEIIITELVEAIAPDQILIIDRKAIDNDFLIEDFLKEVK